jgi:hypothetical protein
MRSLLSLLVEAAYPNEDHDSAAASEPCRTLRLLGLIRGLIDHATRLIASARTLAGTPGFAAFTAPFGTTSLRLLVARFRCAISRAAQLEWKLRGDAGIGSAPQRKTARNAARSRAPRAEPPHKHEAEPVDPELAHLPSAAQIAAEIRRRPVEHVIATICRDLGITPDHTLWQELDRALAAFGVRLTVMPDKPRPPPPVISAQSAPPTRPPQTKRPVCTGPPAAAGLPIAA